MKIPGFELKMNQNKRHFAAPMICQLIIFHHVLCALRFRSIWAYLFGLMANLLSISLTLSSRKRALISGPDSCPLQDGLDSVQLFADISRHLVFP